MHKLRGSGALATVLTLFLLALVTAAPAQAKQPGLDFSCAPPTSASTPLVCLPGGLGEEEHARLSAGEPPIFFAGLVVNDGPDVADASAVITLPGALVSPGTQLVRRVALPIPFDGDESDFLGTALPCTRSADNATITCRTGALAHGQKILILVGLQVAPTAKVGTSATFGLSLAPIAPDTYPTTTVHATIDIVGTPHLQVSIKPKDVSAVVGHSVTLHVRIHNSGTGAAPDTLGFALLFPRHGRDTDRAHFEITNAPNLFDAGSIGGGIFVVIGDAANPTSPAAQLRAGVLKSARVRFTTRLRAAAQARSASASASARSVTPAARTRADQGTPFAVWPLGTIAPGATTSLFVRLRATRLGADELLFSAISEVDDPACSGLVSEPCEEDAVSTLRAVAAPTPPATATPSPAGAGGRLADTGSSAAIPATQLGLLAIVAGAGLLVAGRPRRRTARHRQ